MAKLYLWGAAALGFIVMIATIFTKAESVGRAGEKLKNKTKELEEKQLEIKAIKQEKKRVQKNAKYAHRISRKRLFSELRKQSRKDSD